MLTVVLRRAKEIKDELKELDDMVAEGADGGGGGDDESDDGGGAGGRDAVPPVLT